MRKILTTKKAVADDKKRRQAAAESMLRLGLSREYVAGKLGRSHVAITRWLRGSMTSRPLGIDIALLIAREKKKP